LEADVATCAHCGELIREGEGVKAHAIMVTLRDGTGKTLPLLEGIDYCSDEHAVKSFGGLVPIVLSPLASPDS
jgi:hypothetical protein